jgi:transcription elongation factor GreA
MATEQVPMTASGFDRLSKELEHLRSFERPKVIQEIADARAHGDLRENAEYHAAREKQSLIEGRIGELEDKLSRANIVKHDNDKDGVVRFGAYVTVSDEESGDEKSYQIVGDLEADLAAGRLSMSSPIAKALMGRKVDDLVEILVPKGKREFVITEVKYS